MEPRDATPGPTPHTDPAWRARRHRVARQIVREWRRLASPAATKHADQWPQPSQSPPGTLIACSGGADSVALAIALAGAGGRGPLELAFVRHDMRPRRETDADAAFVTKLAAQLGIRATVLDAPARAADAEPTEAALRKLRYAALARCARERSLRLVATGHHADDQLETLLMAMLRGATARGMRGIAPARPIDRHDPSGPRLVRPMLSVARADARELLTALSAPWREDRTNAEPVTLRNRLRAEVIPRLLELKPAAPERAASLASQMRSLTSLLEHTAATLHAEAVGPEGGWRRDTLRDAETVVIGELIRAEIARRDPACRLDRVGHRSLRAAARAAKDPSGERRVFEVGDGWVVERTKETLRLVRRTGPGADLS